MEFLRYRYVLFGLIICCLFSTTALAQSSDKINTAATLILREEYVEAEELLTKTLKENPKSEDALFYRAKCYYALKRLKDALADCNELLKLNTANAEGYYLRALCKTSLNSHLAAEKDYSDAIILKPEEEHFYAARGQNYFLMGDYDNAINDYTLAIQKNDTEGKYYYKRGITLYIISSKEMGCRDIVKSAELGYAEAFEILKFYCK
jgi:tetratricopeptide (TPR) repeat protein